MAKTKDLPDLQGYSLSDLPDPKPQVDNDGVVLETISTDAKAIVIALLAVATEIRLARQQTEPASEINRLQLDAIKAQMEGGIARVILQPGKSQH